MIMIWCSCSAYASFCRVQKLVIGSVGTVQTGTIIKDLMTGLPMKRDKKFTVPFIHWAYLVMRPPH